VINAKSYAKKKRKKGVKRRVLIFCLWIILVFVILTGFQVSLLRIFNPPFTAFMAWEWLHGKVTSTTYHWPAYQWRSLEEISPFLVRAVLASEDQRFFSHHGFDFIELNKAIQDMIKAKRVRGASTISMQAARTVFLWPERNWLRKIAEAYYTILIEILWGKRRILEIYLNTVDWGKGIMGVAAASQRYFHTEPEKITPTQSALLAAVLPSPHRWSPVSPDKNVIQRKKKIMKDMEKTPFPR